MAVIEMRTYTLKPGTVAAFEDRFAEALPGRMKISPLAAFWHTEIGPLNQVIHVWPYASIEERNQKRAEAIKSGGWPPKTSEFVEDQTSEIYLPAPFSPSLEPRQLGNVYEIRTYTFKPGSMPVVIERWSEKIAERVKLSPLVGAWYSELGGLNKWVHIWAYKDAGERSRIRAEAVSRGIWPPGTRDLGIMVKQENKLVVPAAFSPLR